MKAYLEIEMPTNCAHCMMWSICPALPNGEWPDYESILTNDVIGDGGAALGIRHPDCPLIHVPPHGDLIDRDVLRASIRESIEECHKWADEVDKDTMMYARISQSLGTFVECSLRAKAAPTVIPADPAEEGET